MIGDDDLRDCFAMFAMMGLITTGNAWRPEEVWEIADEMLEARRAPREPEVGIVAVKSRRRK